ncbi:hypothetical protein BT69DRAFT_1297261 [Atractiella rhizophila]|nr:hypothetical protein BT69DRAFT_1297261 [Atractiella rhizophila]
MFFGRLRLIPARQIKLVDMVRRNNEEGTAISERERKKGEQEVRLRGFTRRARGSGNNSPAGMKMVIAHFIITNYLRKSQPPSSHTSSPSESFKHVLTSAATPLTYSAKLMQKANQRAKVFHEDEDRQPILWFSLPPLDWAEDPLEIYRVRSKTDMKEWSQMARDILSIPAEHATQ